MRHCSYIALALLLAGCASEAAVAPSARLTPPVGWAMKGPEGLADPKPSEDAKELLGQCRAAYGKEAQKLAPLQSFARRVTKQQSQPTQ